MTEFSYERELHHVKSLGIHKLTKEQQELYDKALELKKKKEISNTQFVNSYRNIEV